MDVKAIMELMNNTLSFDLRLDDFNHPQPVRVQLICRAFIMYVFDVPESALIHLPLDILTEEDEVEKVQCSAPLIMVYSTMSQFITDNMIGILDPPFGMCDLISPKPPRFRKLMAFLADYLKFYTAMLPHWEQTCSIYAERRNELENLQQEVEEATAKRDSLASEIDSRRRREHELMAILQQKQNQLSEEYRRFQEVEGVLEENKKALEQLNFQRDEFILEKESLQMQLEQISLQLLGSPERVLGELEQYREELAKSKMLIEKQRQCNEETKNHIEHAAKVCQVIDKMGGEYIDKLLKEKAMLDAKLAEKIDAEEEYRESEMRLRNIRDQIERATTDLAESDENLARDQQMYRERMEELSVQKEKLELELEELKKDNSNPAAEIKVQREITAMRAQRTEVINSLKASMEKTTNNYKQLMNTLEEEKAAFYETVNYCQKIMKNTEEIIEPPTDFNDTAGNISML